MISPFIVETCERRCPCMCSHLEKSFYSPASSLPSDAIQQNKTRHQRTTAFEQKVRASINHQEGYHCSRSPTVSCSSMGTFLSENVGVFSSFCFLNGKNWMLWLACLIFTAGLALLWAMWSSVTVLVLAPELSEHFWVLGYPDLVWCFLLLERLFSSRKTAATRHHTIFQDLPTSATEEEGEGEKKEKGEEGRKRSNKDI